MESLLTIDEYVLFIAPSQLQIDVFAKLLDPSVLANYVRGAGIQPLALSMCAKDRANRQSISFGKFVTRHQYVQYGKFLISASAKQER
jgi:hypothetical protein